MSIQGTFSLTGCRLRAGAASVPVHRPGHLQRGGQDGGLPGQGGPHDAPRHRPQSRRLMRQPVCVTAAAAAKTCARGVRMTCSLACDGGAFSGRSSVSVAIKSVCQIVSVVSPFVAGRRVACVFELGFFSAALNDARVSHLTPPFRSPPETSYPRPC